MKTLRNKKKDAVRKEVQKRILDSVQEAPEYVPSIETLRKSREKTTPRPEDVHKRIH